MHKVHQLACGLLATCVVFGTSAQVSADSAPKTAYSPSFVPTKVNRISLFDVVWAGGGLLAVGERGVVFRSSDSGATWKAQRTPTMRTLAGVAFNDEKNGVAVGHGATILRTVDGGGNWQQVVVDDAGKDSLLGVAALGETRIVAYGSFGLYLESNDNGQTWKRHKIIDGEFDRHISQVVKVGEKFLLVGESATLALSDDATTWKRMESPYKGSWFGGLMTKGGAWLIYGMRGNVYRSENAGADWTKIEVGGQQSLMNGRVLEDGRIVLVGISGKIVISNDDGVNFAPLKSAVSAKSRTGIAIDKRQTAFGG